MANTTSKPVPVPKTPSRRALMARVAMKSAQASTAAGLHWLSDPEISGAQLLGPELWKPELSSPEPGPVPEAA